MKKLLVLAFLGLFGSSAVMAQSSVEPPNGMSEIQAYSIFYENYKGESYESAVKFGRWIWQGMPETIEGYSRFDLKRNLTRLVKSYNELAQQKDDPSQREAYVDTALTIYDRLFEKYPNAESDHYTWHINRGRLIQTHSSIVNNSGAKAAEDYYAAYQINPEEFTNYGNGYYIRVMLQEMIREDKKDEALAVIKEAEPYASEKLKNAFDDMREKLFDTPEERIAFLEGQLKDSPENEEVLKSLQELYSDEGMSNKAREVSEKLYELNPSFENIMAIAEFATSNANYSEAIKYLKEALQKTDDEEEKADIALRISDAYLNSDQLEQARNFARQAIDHDADWGAPYINIADIYARAVNQCASNRKMERRDKAVYWLVLDYLDKAREVDPNTANEVERKYDSYNSVLPTTEEKFFWDPPLEEGDEFEIDGNLMECYGWINETTTVR